MARRSKLPVKEMTPQKWKTFLEEIAHGAKRHEAIHAADITNQTLHLYLHLQPDAMDQYRIAQATFLKKDWDIGLLEQVLEKIAGGLTVKQACSEHDIDFRKFVGLMLKDATLRDMYDDARKISLEIMADENLRIADDSSNDRDEDGKPNHELVNRDRLRVSARQWTMQRLFPDRYGEKSTKTIDKTVTINHVETLDGARKRKEAAHQRKQQIIQQQQNEKNGTVH